MTSSRLPASAASHMASFFSVCICSSVLGTGFGSSDSALAFSFFAAGGIGARGAGYSTASVGGKSYSCAAATTDKRWKLFRHQYFVSLGSTVSCGPSKQHGWMGRARHARRFSRSYCNIHQTVRNLNGCLLIAASPGTARSTQWRE